MIRRIGVATVVLVALAATISCSGGGPMASAPLPNIAGAWEFEATSNLNSNTFTGIEAALQEGQTIVNGMQQANGQISANGASQIAIVEVNPANNTVIFGGGCAASGGGGNALTGSIQSFAGPFNFSLTENGNVFNVTGTISADGQSFTGTYSPDSSNTCPDTGTITGAVVPKFAGTYGGQLTLPDGVTYDVTAAMSENSSSVLTINIQATSPNTVALSVTGPATGNAFLVQGTYQQQQVTYEGYFGVQTTTGQNAPGIYFVNATNSAQPSYAGTLVPALN